MKVVKTSSINPKGDISTQLLRINQDLTQIINCLQGRVRLGSGSDGARGENVLGEFQVVADTGAADTEFSITHTLGAVPIGFLVTKKNKSGGVYDSGTAWTATTIYLKCASANAAITVFLLQ